MRTHISRIYLMLQNAEHPGHNHDAKDMPDEESYELI